MTDDVSRPPTTVPRRHSRGLGRPGQYTNAILTVQRNRKRYYRNRRNTAAIDVVDNSVASSKWSLCEQRWPDNFLSVYDVQRRYHVPTVVCNTITARQTKSVLISPPRCRFDTKLSFSRKTLLELRKPSTGRISSNEIARWIRTSFQNDRDNCTRRRSIRVVRHVYRSLLFLSSNSVNSNKIIRGLYKRAQTSISGRAWNN